MKEVPVGTNLLLIVYGEISPFLILLNALVWTAPTRYATFSGQISKFSLIFCTFLVGVSKFIVGQMHTLGPPLATGLIPCVIQSFFILPTFI